MYSTVVTDDFVVTEEYDTEHIHIFQKKHNIFEQAFNNNITSKVLKMQKLTKLEARKFWRMANTCFDTEGTKF